MPHFYNSPETTLHFVQYIKIGNYSAKFGLDGISLLFILLTSALTLACIISNWHRSAQYLGLLLLLEGIIIGLFSSLDLISFYIFFETSLIPMFFIIGVWGGDKKIYAAFKFFLYTFVGSTAFLIAIVYMYLRHHTAEISFLIEHLDLSIIEQRWIWFALFIAFAVKIPMFPFHTWLPDAHVQAPTAGSVMLAGILIKMGVYGFLRLLIPIFPEVSQEYSQMIFILSSIAMIYTSLVALVQSDIKKVIAYSSIAHMGLVTAGIFSFNEQGVTGAIFQMFSHGIVSAGLFLCIGIIYDRKHTRNISDYSGLANVMPFYSTSFIIFSMASIGMPGTSGFVGELLSIIGIFKTSKIAAVFLASGVVLGATYMLWLCKRVIWGETIKQVENMGSLTHGERFTLIFLLILTLAFGIQPQFIITLIETPVHNLIKIT